MRRRLGVGVSAGGPAFKFDDAAQAPLRWLVDQLGSGRWRPIRRAFESCCRAPSGRMLPGPKLWGNGRNHVPSQRRWCGSWPPPPCAAELVGLFGAAAERHRLLVRRSPGRPALAAGENQPRRCP